MKSDISLAYTFAGLTQHVIEAPESSSTNGIHLFEGDGNQNVVLVSLLAIVLRVRTYTHRKSAVSPLWAVKHLLGHRC